MVSFRSRYQAYGSDYTLGLQRRIGRGDALDILSTDREGCLEALFGLVMISICFTKYPYSRATSKT
jgi:hypothetical protein